MSKDNSGPAFPVPSEVYNDNTTGMTLRDYFAIEAEQSALNVPRTVAECRKALNLPEDEPWTESRWYELVAQERYRFAEAMLKEREK